MLKKKDAHPIPCIDETLDTLELLEEHTGLLL